MRKVTTINLNNNAYQIDEDGYEALRAYLDKAARALASNPDREEILSDLEQAIADKCLLTLGPHKTVVSTTEIERILDEMGPVAGGTEDAASGKSPPSGPDAGDAGSGSPGFRGQRLYRITEGRKIWGICNGLAAFAGIDVTLVRIAVVLITIFTGFFPGLIIYFVLYFVMPVAATPEELAAAHGQPFRAQEVVDRARKKRDEWRSGREQRRENRRERRRMRQAWWSPQPTPVAAPGATARVTGGVLLPLLTVLSAAWFSAMATIAYVVWQGWYRAGFNAWPSGSWQGHADFPRWVALVAVIAIYALLAIPIGSARRAALYYANGGRLHGAADAWSGLLWIAVVALLLLGGWWLMPQLQDELWQLLHAPLRGISV